MLISRSLFTAFVAPLNLTNLSDELGLTGETTVWPLKDEYKL